MHHVALSHEGMFTTATNSGAQDAAQALNIVPSPRFCRHSNVRATVDNSVGCHPRQTLATRLLRLHRLSCAAAGQQCLPRSGPAYNCISLPRKGRVAPCTSAALYVTTWATPSQNPCFMSFQCPYSCGGQLGQPSSPT